MYLHSLPVAREWLSTPSYSWLFDNRLHPRQPTCHMLSPCSELVRVGNHCADKRGVHHPQDFIVRHPGFDGA